ncbi:winged helix-turn-helix domain-containing protein [Aliikangiella sp. IMCC44359]|uniref:winged helix-turn-helix domain-containing protein n=1 Tax=Aliikangiella sp. IMCC44359 TaxID=3459125 RepID=UPI00403AA683
MNDIIQLKIGDCHIFPQEFAIQFGDEHKISLQPKFIEVILYLANNYPRIISRNELIDNVWNGNYYVGEKSLTNAIWQIRKNLRCESNDSEVIETIRKKGYRLLIKPEILEVESIKNNPTELAKKYFTWERMTTYALVAVICLFLGWYFAGTNDYVGTATVKNITTEPGQEIFSSPSPDGRFIAYRWRSPENDHNLFLKDLEQPDIPHKQLTFGKVHAGHSTWSNNGEYLFYSRADYRVGVCDIIRLNIATLKEKKIADCPTDRGYRYISISPDNKTLAYRSNHEPEVGSGIYFINLLDEKATPIRFSCKKDCGYRDRDMAFSPDGKSILVSRRYNALSENLFLVDLVSKDTKQITYAQENIVGFSWHPKGDRIVYSTERADVYHGYLLNLNTDKTYSLNLDGFSFPVFTRNETPSLFYLQISEIHDILTFDIDAEIASSPFPILRSEFSHRTPDYSSVSKQIAFVSNESGHYELWLSDIEGNHRERLTNLKSYVRYPRWSNDGSRIVFLAQVGDNPGRKIHIIDLKSRQPKVLNTAYADHDRPTWSLDNHSIISSVTQDKKTNLYRFDIESGKAKQLTFNGGIFGVASSSDKLYFTKETQRGLWQVDFNRNITPTEKQVINSNKFMSRYTWTHTSKGIFFRQTKDNHQRISFFDFKHKNIIPIVKLPGVSSESFGSLTYVDDKKTLIFAQRGKDQGNIKQLSHPLFD